MSYKTIFYKDAAIADVPLATETENINVSPAEAMAKGGYKSSNEEVADMPIIIQNKKVEPKEEEETTPAATATVVKETEEVKPEVQENAVKEEVKVEEPLKLEQLVKPLTLQEVLKKEQPNTVLKELGFDERTAKFVNELKDYDPKVIGILEAYKEGKLNDYLKELSTDYAKMPAEEVMRHQLRQEYPKASEKQLDIIFKKEIVSEYNLNSFDEEEKEEGLELLNAKADKYRDALIKNQESYLLPKAPEKQVEVDNTNQLVENALNDFKIQITDSPFTKQLIETKQLVIGEGDDKFSYNVTDTDNLLSVLYDSDKWADGIFTTEKQQDGTEKLIPDVEKQLLIALVHQDHKGFLKEIGKHYKALGGKSAIEPIENAKVPESVNTFKSDTSPQSPAEAMAKGGSMVSGGR